MAELDFSTPFELEEMLREDSFRDCGTVLLGPDVAWGNRGSLSPHSDSSASPPAQDPEMLDLIHTLQTSEDPAPVPETFKVGLTHEENVRLVRSLGEHASLCRQPRARIIPTARAIKLSPPPTKRRRLPSRSPSPTPSDLSTTSKRSNWGSSNSKQAVYAKQYRAANKSRLSEMEARIRALETENGELSGKMATMAGRESELEDEIHYLRTVLTHDSQIATIIGGVQTSVTGRISLPFPSSSSSPVTKSSSATTTTSTRGKRKAATKKAGLGSAGVCLHVQDGGVSIEFCGKCNARSRSDL